MSETPIQVTEPSLVVPILDDIPEDDTAEADDASVEHLATPDEVGE